MYSSSSSDCDCVDYCQYGQCVNDGHFTSVRPTPWYPSAVNPLVYYAQVAPANRRQRIIEKQKRPNCFVKAFRWYTQERIPNKREEDTGVSSFATWLDAKYGEYLQSNNDRLASFKVKNVSTLEVKSSNPGCDESCSRTKFLHGKRTWRKRTRVNKEAGDLNNETVISRTRLETLLHPKEMTGPASEYWHPNEFKTQDTYGNQSTFTITSCDTPVSDKTSKIHSRMRACKDDCTYPQGSKLEIEQEIRVINPDSCSAKDQKRVVKSSSSKSQRVTEQLTKDNQFACQYPEEKLQCNDAQMQHQVSKVDKTCSGCDKDPEFSRSQEQSRTATKTQRVLKTQPKYVNPRSQGHRHIDYTDVSCQCSGESIQKRRNHYDICSAHNSNSSQHQVHKKMQSKSNKRLLAEKSIKRSQRRIDNMDCVGSDVSGRQKYENCSQCQLSEDPRRDVYEHRRKQETQSKSDFKRLAAKKSLYSQQSADSVECVCRDVINKHKIHSYGQCKHGIGSKKYSYCLHNHKLSTHSRTDYKQAAAVTSVRGSHHSIQSIECICPDVVNTQRVDAFSQYIQEMSSDSDSCDIHKHKQETPSTTSASQRLYKIDDREKCRDVRCCDIENCIASGPRPYSAAVCDVAQTSDLSLNLANESRHRYPLFMKIVRADKN